MQYYHNINVINAQIVSHLHIGQCVILTTVINIDLKHSTHMP